MNQAFDTHYLTRIDHVICSAHVDRLEERRRTPIVDDGGRMDNPPGSKALEGPPHLCAVGDVDRC